MHRSSSVSSLASSSSESDDTMQIFVKNVSGTSSKSTARLPNLVLPNGLVDSPIRDRC